MSLKIKIAVGFSIMKREKFARQTLKFLPILAMSSSRVAEERDEFYVTFRSVFSFCN